MNTIREFLKQERLLFTVELSSHKAKMSKDLKKQMLDSTSIESLMALVSRNNINTANRTYLLFKFSGLNQNEKNFNDFFKKYNCKESMYRIFSNTVIGRSLNLNERATCYDLFLQCSDYLILKKYLNGYVDAYGSNLSIFLANLTELYICYLNDSSPTTYRIRKHRKFLNMV